MTAERNNFDRIMIPRSTIMAKPIQRLPNASAGRSRRSIC